MGQLFPSRAALGHLLGTLRHELEQQHYHRLA